MKPDGWEKHFTRTAVDDSNARYNCGSQGHVHGLGSSFCNRCGWFDIPPRKVKS